MTEVHDNEMSFETIVHIDYEVKIGRRFQQNPIRPKKQKDIFKVLTKQSQISFRTVVKLTLRRLNMQSSFNYTFIIIRILCAFTCMYID